MELNVGLWRYGCKMRFVSKSYPLETEDHRVMKREREGISEQSFAGDPAAALPASTS